jgi:hypothetical protein
MAHPAFWLVALLIPFGTWLVFRTALPGRLGPYYREHFRDARRERVFLASVGFYLAFALIRGITHAIRAGVGPFHDVSAGGLHIHHLVWGILLLLGIGYLWLLQIGTTGDGPGRRLSRLTAGLYGVGAALTLDEFALWLRLQDVYWSRQGRESVDAVLLFGAMLSITLGGGRLFRRLLRELVAALGAGRRRAAP